MADNDEVKDTPATDQADGGGNDDSAQNDEQDAQQKSEQSE